jgi:hypothetical protein
MGRLQEVALDTQHELAGSIKVFRLQPDAVVIKQVLAKGGEELQGIKESTLLLDNAMNDGVADVYGCEQSWIPVATWIKPRCLIIGAPRRPALPDISDHRRRTCDRQPPLCPAQVSGRTRHSVAVALSQLALSEGGHCSGVTPPPRSGPPNHGLRPAQGVAASIRPGNCLRLGLSSWQVQLAADHGGLAAAATSAEDGRASLI